MFIQGREVQSQRSGLGQRPTQVDQGGVEFGRIDDPAANVRVASLTSEALQLVGIHPATLRHHPVHRPVRAGAGCAVHGIHVQDLATPDGFGPAGFPHDEAVTGQQREGYRQVQTDSPAGAGLQSVRAQYPHPYRVLAGTQVEHMGTASRHRMVQLVQDRQGGVNHHGVVPLA